MPNYHSYEWDDIKVEVKPLGIRKCWLLRKLPYFTGSKIKFKVVIKTISREPSSLSSDMRICEPDGDELGGEICLSVRDTEWKVIERKIESPPVGVSGDHRVRLSFATNKLLNKRDIVTLKAIAQDSLTISIVILAFTVFGGVIGSIITHSLF